MTIFDIFLEIRKGDSSGFYKYINVVRIFNKILKFSIEKIPIPFFQSLFTQRFLTF